MIILKIITDCLTGKDNATYDIVRVLIFVGGFAFIIYAGIAVWKYGTFSAQDFGIGMGALLGGGGAAIGMKSKSEPEEKDDVDNR